MSEAFKSYLESVRDGSRQKAQNEMRLLRQTTAIDKVEEAFKLASETGRPAMSTLLDLDNVRADLQAEREKKALEKSQQLTGWINESGENAAAAAIDVEGLAALEQIGLGGDTPSVARQIYSSVPGSGTALGRGVESGTIGIGVLGQNVRLYAKASNVSKTQSYLNQLMQLEMAIQSGTEVTDDMLMDILGPADEGTLLQPKIGTIYDTPRSIPEDRLRKYAAASPEERSALLTNEIVELLGDRESMVLLTQVIAAYKAEMPEGEEMTWSNLHNFAANSLGQAVPYIAAMMTISALTGGTGLMVSGTVAGIGDITDSAVEAGLDLTDPNVANAIFAGAVLYGATEFIGVVGRSARAPVREIFTGVPEELVRSAMKNVGIKYTGAVAANAFEEGLNELLQEMIVQMTVNGEVDMTPEGFRKLLEAFAAGAFGGAGISAVTEGVSLRRQKAAVDEAEKSQSELVTLQELDDMAAGAKLKQSAPAKFEEYMDKLGYNKRAIHVDARGLQSQIADGSITPEQLGTTADELQAAADAGTRIAVPTSKYLTNVSGTPLAGWFRDNAAMRAEGMTGSELQTFERVKRELEAEIAAEQTREQEGQTTRQRAYNQLYGQLVAAGQTRRLAKGNATVQIAFMETMGARMGIDDIYERFGVKVQGPPQRAMAQETVDELRTQYYQSPLEFSQIDNVDALQLRPEQRERIQRGEIVDEPSVYLYATPDSQRVPLSQVIPIRRRPEGVENAVPLMASAARGGKRRQPLTVTQNEDGSYTLLDGNSTYAVLEQAGAQELVVRVVSPEGWSTEQEVDKVRKVLKDRTKKPRMINAGKMDATTFAIAWAELRRLQPFNSLEEMIGTDGHKADQDYVNELGQRIGRMLGVTVKAAPPKNMARSSEKVNGKYNGDQRLLGDSVRTGFTATTLDDARTFINEIAKEHTVVVEPFNVTDEGYFDQKASFLLPSGRWAEIQIWPPGMAEAKDAGGHAAYMRFREDKGQYSFEEKMAARNEMLDLYGQVMAELDGSWLGVLGEPLSRNSDLAARIPEMARLYSSSDISGDRSSNRISSAETDQLASPVDMTAVPSSSSRTTPGSDMKNLGMNVPPFDGNVDVSAADVQSVRQFPQGSVADRRSPATQGALTGIPLTNTLAASAELVRNGQFRTGRDLKLALQERALAGQQAAGIDLTQLTEENIDRIADYVYEDALEAVQDNLNAIGWYDNAVTTAKAELAKIYPEIAEGGEAEFAFIWALAVTSNGLKVNKNFELAAAAYDEWKAKGKFPKNIGIGTAAKAINEGLAMYDRMVERFGGWEQARDFMVSQHEVREIERQSGKSITGEGKGEIVRGAAILGPKIGNGFFSNLYGYFDGLTMDRWLVRSFGRWRGTLVYINEAMIQQKRDQMRNLFTALTPGELTYLEGFYNGSDIKLSPEMTDAELDKLADETKKRSMAKDWRDHIAKAEQGDLLRKLGNSLWGYNDGQVEQPGGTKDRSFMRQSMQRALERLRQTPGLEALTMADLQALLWYPEKLMYDSAKKPEGVDIRSYDDDEAPDYANAARTLVADRLGRGANDSAGGAGSGGPAGTVAGTTDVAAVEGTPGTRGSAGGRPRPSKPARRVYSQADATPDGQLSPVSAHDLYNLTPEFFDRPGWAVVTATREDLNPDFKEMLNARANNQLRERLEYMGIPFIEVDGRYEGEYQGTSFLIVADKSTAMKLGKENMQESILTNEGLVYTLRPLPTVPNAGSTIFGEEARSRDFYSETRDGVAFSMNLDFSVGPGQPVLGDGFVWLTDKPQLPVRASDGMVELHHWSSDVLDTVDPNFAGTGPLKGVERQRGAKLSFFGINPRDNQRQPGTGYVKESGLGQVHHVAEVDPSQLYDWVNDPQGLAPEGLTANDFQSAYEAAIEAAGYLGYYTVDNGDVRNPSAPLGNVAALFKAVPVKVVPAEGLQQGDRGMITIPGAGIQAGEAVIDLFERADESTFMHETGHFMLEVFRNLSEMPEAPQQMKDDLAKIHEWMGKTDGEPYTVEQQEMWAEAFEVYLMEGKAPSEGLRGAFTQFARWLTRLYKAAVNIGTQPSDDVRAIMDRMLATDAEIAAAKQEGAMDPLFKDPGAAGMSAEEWETYRRVAERGDDEAFRRLLNKTMEAVRRKTQKWWRDELKATREQVMGELSQTPVYRMIEKLANEKADLRMDKDELVELFGEDVLNQISPKQIGGKRQLWQEGGVPLRVLADLFGFKDEGDMIEQLRQTVKLQEAVVTEANRRMEQRHGDPLKDENIREEALAALKNSSTSERTAREISTLERAAGRGPNRWQVQNRQARAAAQEMIAKMSVRQVLGYRGFARTAAKFAREAQAKLAEVVRRADGTPTMGGRAALNAAAEAKRKQLLNDHLYREARERARKIESFRKRVKRMEKQSIRQNIGADFMAQIDEILERYEFKNRSQRDISNRVSLRSFVQDLEINYRGGELAIAQEVMDDIQQVNYTELNSELLDAVIDAVDNLAHMGRQTTKARLQSEQVALEQVVDEIVSTADVGIKDVQTPRGAAERSAFARTIRQSVLWVLNASTTLLKLDNGKVMGPAYRSVKLAVDKASQNLQERREDAAAFIQDKLYLKHYTMKEVMAYRRSKKYYPELGDTLTKWEVIALAMNSGNKGNFERLTNKDGKGTYDADSVNEVLSRELSERDWRFVQDTWDYIGSFWGDISALEKRMTGIVPKRVDAQIMVDAPDFVTGGYFPIAYDYDLSVMANDQMRSEDALNGFSGRFGKAQTRHGFTKERTATTGQPVLLDMGVIENHVFGVIHDLTMREAMHNSWKVITHPKFADMMLRKGMGEDRAALELWLQDTAAGDRTSAHGLEVWLRWMRGGFTLGKLGFNVSTAMIQPLGLTQSMVVVGKTAMIRGMTSYLSNPKDWHTLATSKSAAMRERIRTFERDMMQVSGELKTGTANLRTYQQVINFMVPYAYWLMQRTQYWAVDLPTFVASYERSLRDGKTEQEAVDIAEFEVARAQGSGLMSDRGMIERGTIGKKIRQSELPRLFTVLASYMFAKFNLAHQRIGETQFTDPVSVLKLMADLSLMFTLEAVLVSLMRNGLPDFDEDDETDALDFAKLAARETGLTMLGTFPVARDVGSGLSGFGTGGTYESYTGAVSDLLQSGGKALSGEEFTLNNIQSLISVGGTFFFIPTSQLNRTMDAFITNDFEYRDPSALEAIGAFAGVYRPED